MAKGKFLKREVMAHCVPMSILQSVLGGKWKFLILWYIAIDEKLRFSELLRHIDGITQSTLTKQLRELENDGFIIRKVYPEIPPKVEYSLSVIGKSFVPILTQMMLWSQKHLCEKNYKSPYSSKEIRRLLGKWCCYLIIFFHCFAAHSCKNFF